MARALVLGNGTMLLTLDRAGQVRDVYFPHVGLENHTSGSLKHRVGVFADGRVSWFGSAEWKTAVSYREETMVSRVDAENASLGVAVQFADVVYNEKAIFVRRVRIKNLRSESREIKIFFNQQFQISETGRGDTAYYDPYEHVIVHYKGRRVFLVAGQLHGDGAETAANFDDYSVGLMNVEGREGTWRDAEDGALSKNSIEHGSVDSTIGFTAKIAGGASCDLTYWLAAAKTIAEAHALHAYVMKKTPEHLIKTTKDFWHAWVNRVRFNFFEFSKDIVRLFKTSLLVARTHVDARGAVLASGDSSLLQYGRDTYGYMWPRDASFTILALEKAGDASAPRRFFELANRIISDDGYFMHKYRADGSLGSSWHPWVRDGKPSLPIQEDETAVVLTALWTHYALTKDLEFIEGIYNSMIERAANFLSSYVDTKTGLPKASYDLWEEKYGVHTYTAASVHAALLVAAEFATLLGKVDAAAWYRAVARTMREAILAHLWSDEAAMFLKSTTDRTIDMSSFHGVVAFGVLDPHDERVKRAARTIEERLVTRGGVSRYVGDQYFHTGGSAPSNPWFITTLWLAQYYIAAAKTREDLKRADAWLNWAAERASASGMMSEQLNPATGEQISVSPLIWSHAEFVITVIRYLEKLQDLGLCVACYPLDDRF